MIPTLSPIDKDNACPEWMRITGPAFAANIKKLNISAAATAAQAHRGKKLRYTRDGDTEEYRTTLELAEELGVSRKAVQYAAKFGTLCHGGRVERIGG